MHYYADIADVPSFLFFGTDPTRQNYVTLGAGPGPLWVIMRISRRQARVHQIQIQIQTPLGR